MLELIDDTDGLVFKSKGGVRQLIKIRNRFGHNLSAKLSLDEMKEISRGIGPYLEGRSEARKEMIHHFDKLRSEGKFEDLPGNFDIGLIFEWADKQSNELPGKIQQRLLEEGDPREALTFFTSSFHDYVAIETWRMQRGRNVTDGSARRLRRRRHQRQAS